MLILKGITKVDERSDAELIANDVVTYFRNMILKGAKAYKRGALKRFNSNNGGTNTFVSLFNTLLLDTYSGSSGDSVNMIFGLVGDGDDDDDGILKYSINGTGAWNTAKSGLNDTEKIRHAVYKDKLLLTNGEDTPFIIGDYDSNAGTIQNWDLTIEAPDVQATTMAISAGGSLDTSALYRYIMVYTTGDGQQGQVSKPFTHIEGATDITTTDGGGNNTVDFTDLPTSSDTRVTGRKLYRTEGGGEVFYLLTSLDNSDTTYSDDVADTELKTYDSIELFQELETAKYNLIHKDRYWLGNVVTGLGKSVNTPTHFPFTATAGDNSAAGMDDGTYRYAMSFVDNQGRESELSTYVEVELDRNIGGWAVGEAKVVINSFPRPRIGAGDLDGTIVERRIYRTKATDNATYYYLASSGTLTSTSDITDTSKDTALTETYPKNSEGRSIADKTHKCGIIYSNLGDPSEFNVLNYKEVYPDDGDEITGLVGQPDGVLVFKTNSICKVYTQGAHENWRVVKLVENLGCDEPNSISEVENRVYFMNKSKVYRFPDALTNPISEPKETTLNAVSSVYDSIFYVEKRWYVIATSNYVVHVYDERENCWYEFVSGSMTIKSLAEMLYGSDKGKLLLGVFAEAIMLYYDESTKLDYSTTGGTEDTDISCAIKSKHWTKGETVTFRLLELWSNYKKEDDKTVTHLIINPETSSQVTANDTANSAVSSDYKNYYQVTDGMTGTLKRAKKLRYEISGAGLEEFNFMNLKAMEESGRKPNV
jgi:hypothetical protein